jgi:hypothetical protein
MQHQNGIVGESNLEVATKVAAEYIAATLGNSFSVGTIQPMETTWRVQIQGTQPEAETPFVVGSLSVDKMNGQVVPLTASQISDIRERLLLFAAHRRGEMARDNYGYLLPSQAKVKAAAYAADHIAFFARAEGQPTWITGTPPYWRVTITLNLRGLDRACELGFVEVNAVSGEVLKHIYEKKTENHSAFLLKLNS